MMMAKWYPFVPTLFTMALQPISVIVVRVLLSKRSAKWGLQDMHDSKSDNLNTDDKLRALKDIVGEEGDNVNYLKAALVAFWVSAAACIGLWVQYAMIAGRGLERLR